MGRSPCCDKIGLKKGPWTQEEDQKLLAYIQQHGHGSWRALPSKAGLQRCGKSCRLRWTNYLRPDIKRGKFSLQEEQTIIQLHALLGNRWSAIATHMPKRTDNEIKNYWNTHLKKRLTKMGIDPVTHKPKNDALLSSDGQSKNAAKLSHMAQWETARLEAEARLVRQSKLRSSPSTFFQAQSATPKIAVGPARCMDMQKAWNDGDLESPTSTLIPAAGIRETAFIELVRKLSSGVGVIENTTKEECEEEWKHQLAEINIEGIENSVPLMHEKASFQSGWESMSPVPCGNFVDKFTDLLHSTSSGDRRLYADADVGDPDNIGSYCNEDNKNYWNSILNLVNSPPPDDSPMF